MQSSVNDLRLFEHHEQIIAQIWSNSDIDRKMKGFLSALAGFFNFQTQCAFPSRRQIAGRLGNLSSSRISYYINQAVKNGLITSEARYELVDKRKRTYRQTSNLYRFNLQALGLLYDPKKIAAKKLKDEKLAAKKHTKHSANKQSKAKSSSSIDRTKLIDNANFEFDKNYNQIQSAMNDKTGNGYQQFQQQKLAIWKSPPK